MGAAASPARRPQEGSAVWRTGDLRPSDWTVELDDVQRAAIVDAARRAAAGGLTADTVTAASFPLPALQPALRAWTEALAAGLGFVLLRGFPIDQLDEAETELAYVGFGSHLGRPVSQNAAGELLTHVRDERLGEQGPHVRRYRTRERQDFHSDGADLIGLLCLHGARSGGESRIVSSLAVYNEILRRRPDLLEVLYQPFHWDRQGNDDAVGSRWFVLPPVSDLADGPRVFYIGWYLRDAQRHPEVPRLTDAQLEAMALLESIANDPSFHLQMAFAPGDVQVLNNGRILHSREAYEDEEDPAARRHLLRLWLAAHAFTSLEDGLRTGITAPA